MGFFIIVRAVCLGFKTAMKPHPLRGVFFDIFFYHGIDAVGVRLFVRAWVVIQSGAEI